MKILEKLKSKSILAILSLVLLILVSKCLNFSIITKSKLEEYKSLDVKIEKLNEQSSKYDSENSDDISAYLDLRVKYEDMEKSFNEYKEKYSDELAEEIETAKNEVNKYYLEAIKLENELKVTKAKNEKEKVQVASSSTPSYSNSSSSSSSNYSHSSSSNSDKSSSNKHLGKSVYVSNGNSYYHAISNCKYLEGAKTSLVTLTSSMRKYECNCWTNPVVYKKPSTNYSSSSPSSSGRTVYIASGNSYYHNSSSCKFLQGASVRTVSINNVGGKHPCNCVKY